MKAKNSNEPLNMSTLNFRVRVDGKFSKKNFHLPRSSRTKELVDELLREKLLETRNVTVYNQNSNRLRWRDKVGQYVRDGETVIVTSVGVTGSGDGERDSRRESSALSVQSDDDGDDVLNVKRRSSEVSTRRKKCRKVSSEQSDVTVGRSSAETEQNCTSGFQEGERKLDDSEAADSKASQNNLQSAENGSQSDSVTVGNDKGLKFHYDKIFNHQPNSCDEEQPKQYSENVHSAMYAVNPKWGLSCQTTDGKHNRDRSESATIGTETTFTRLYEKDDADKTIEEKNICNDATDDSDDIMIVEVIGEKQISKEKIISNLRGILRKRRNRTGNGYNLTVVFHELQKIFKKDLSDRYEFIKNAFNHMTSKPNSWLAESESRPEIAVSISDHHITTEDLKRLNGQNWLNDSIINGYSQLLMMFHSDVFIFSTYFYPQLKSKGYLGVKKWIKKVDIFKKRLLLFPIHLGLHWTLVACNLSKKTLIYLDSLAGFNEHCLKRLMQFLRKSAFQQDKDHIVSGWQAGRVESIPLQKNVSDCGVFVCQYSKRFCKSTAMDFCQSDIPRLRKQMIQELQSKTLL